MLIRAVKQQPFRFTQPQQHLIMSKESALQQASASAGQCQSASVHLKHGYFAFTDKLNQINSFAGIGLVRLPSWTRNRTIHSVGLLINEFLHLILNKRHGFHSTMIGDKLSQKIGQTEGNVPRQTGKEQQSARK